MSDINIEAILGSDHMTRTPEGHDPDRWFRVTILELAGEIRQLKTENKDAWEQFDELRHGSWRQREQ